MSIHRRPKVVTSWESLPLLPPQAGLSRRSIAGDELMLMRVEFEAGAVVPAHRHAQEQFTIVLEGRLRFRVGEVGEEREEIAGPGRVVHCPGGVLHSAEALEPTIEIDAFTPIRPELLAAADAPSAADD